MRPRCDAGEHQGGLQGWSGDLTVNETGQFSPQPGLLAANLRFRHNLLPKPAANDV